MNILFKSKATPAKDAEDWSYPVDIEVDQVMSVDVEVNQANEVNQGQPKDTEGVKGDEKFVPSTSSYKSLDSIKEKSS